MSRPHSFVLAQFRGLFSSRTRGVRNRNRRQQQIASTGRDLEVLEQRQLLIQPPVSLATTGGVGATPIAIQWVQPTSDPATSFDVTIARTGFTGPLQQDVFYATAVPSGASGSTQTYQIAAPLAQGTYSASIRSRANDGGLSTPSTIEFTVGPAVSEVLSVSGRGFPANSAIPSVGTNVSIQWALLPGVNQYEVSLERKNLSGTYETFAGSVQSVQGGVYEGILALGEYRVKIRDLNVSPAVWSASREFVVSTEQSAVPTWKSSSTQLSDGAALSWNAVSSAVRYEVEITGTTSVTATVIGTEYRGAFLPTGSYSARVRAITASDQLLPWSTSQTFAVGASTYQPVLVSQPSGTQLNGIARTAWQTKSWASEYEIAVLTTTGTVISRQRIRDNWLPGVTQSFVPQTLSAGSYSISIRAVDSVDTGVSVSTATFQVTSETYRLPLNDWQKTQNGIQITWPQVPGALRYDVWIDKLNAAGTATEIPSFIRETVPAEAFSLDQRFPEGSTYKAWVRPVLDGSVAIPWSYAKTLSPSFSNSVVVSVVETKDKGRPKISWTELPGAVSYRVLVEDKTVVGSTVVVQDVTGITASTWTPDNPIAAGNYTFSVQASLSGGQLIVGTSQSFSVSGGPTGTILTQNPQFTWPRISGASSYELWVTKNGNNNAPYFPVATPAANYYVHSSSLAAGDYTFWYRGRNSAGTPFGNWSSPITFNVPSAANISISQSFDSISVAWDSPAEGMYDIRIVQADESSREVLREQFYREAGTSIRSTHALKSGIAPGLYRVDVGQASASGVHWNRGPVFRFDGSNLEDFSANGTMANASAANLSGPFRGDFDGDGDLDVALRQTSNGAVTVSVNNSTAIAPTATWNYNGTGGYSDVVTSQVNPILTGDFNGDGRDDLVQPIPESLVWTVLRAGTTSSFQAVNVPVAAPGNPDLPAISWNYWSRTLSWMPVKTPVVSQTRTYEVRVVSSQNASSRPTVVRTFLRTADDNSASTLSESLSSLADGEYTVFVRTTVDGRTSQWSDGLQITCLADVSSANGKTAWQNFLVGDLNADGRDDVAAFNTVRQQWTAFISTGTTFEQSVWTPSTRFAGSYSRHTLADVNGDGREDILFKDNTSNQWIVNLSTGTSFLTQAWSTSGSPFMQDPGFGSSLMVADFNSDGREDLMGWVGADLKIALSGSGEFSSFATVSGMPASTQPVDLNGDGKIDLVGFDVNDVTKVAINLGTSFNPAETWQVDSVTPWVTKLSVGGTFVADFGYRARETDEAFDWVHNNIQFDAYRGIKKGADGTAASMRGNAWDQAELLRSKIFSSQLTRVRYVTGTLELTPGQAQNWFGTSTIPMDMLQEAGLNPSIVPATGNLKIDHAWIQAWLPKGNTLGWVNLNPALKEVSSLSPVAAPDLFTPTDLNNLLSTSSNSVTQNFDNAQTGSLRGIDFNAGGGFVAAVPGSTTNYRFQTSHNTATNMLIGESAYNGTLEVDISAPVQNDRRLHDFRVFARATEDYEVGLEYIASIQVENADSIRLYERNETSYRFLTATVTANAIPAGDSFNPPTLTNEVPMRVTLIVENGKLDVFLQIKTANGVTSTKYSVANLFTNTATPKSPYVAGRFGVLATGRATHFIDNMKLVSNTVSDQSPVDSVLTRLLSTGQQSTTLTTSRIGSTQSVIQSSSASPFVAYTESSNTENLPPSSQWQTVTFRIVGFEGVTTTLETYPSNASTTFRIADIARKNISLRNVPGGRRVYFYLDGVEQFNVWGSTTLRLETEVATPGLSTTQLQHFNITENGSSQIVLRADQFSGADLANVSAALSTAYAAIPITAATGLPSSAFTDDDKKSVTERLLYYAGVRLLTASDEAERAIGRLTDALIVRPSVSVGLLSSGGGWLNQRDSVYFVRPKEMSIDFPVGTLMYIPRNGDSAVANSQSNPPVDYSNVQQSRYRLALTELAEIEATTLSEISEKPAMSALSFLSLSRLNGENGVKIRRLRKEPGTNVYKDDWDSTLNSTNLAEAIDFTNANATIAATNQKARVILESQLSSGGVVTITSKFSTINGWNGIGWLLEDSIDVTESGGQPNLDATDDRYPNLKSILFSSATGRLFHGGVIGEDTDDSTSNASLLPDSAVSPDAFQGTLRRSDLDFSIAIPGINIPFNRTWSSSRSDFSDPTTVLQGVGSSDFGTGWMHPFAQQLEISTITEERLSVSKRKSLFGNVTRTTTYMNQARKGEANAIGWRREDGSLASFSPNGVTTTDANSNPTSAEYTSSGSFPGVRIRRNDGITPVGGATPFGDTYDLLFPDGSSYQFRDFNPLSYRNQGDTVALLTSMTDRFGNKIEIIRKTDDPAQIDYIKDFASQRVLARFQYDPVSVTELIKGVELGQPGAKNEQQIVSIPKDSEVTLTFGGRSATLPKAEHTTVWLIKVRKKLEAIGFDPSLVYVYLDAVDTNNVKLLVQFAGAPFSYKDWPKIGTVIRRIEVPAASGLATPSAGVSGSRIWDYTYGDGSLISVTASESTGTGLTAPAVNTLNRYQYEWYQRADTNETLTRGHRLAGLMKSSTSFASSAAADGAPFKTSYEYYGNGRLRSIKDPEGAKSQFVYDAFGNATTVIDAMGRMSTNHFSNRGEMVSSVSAVGDRTYYEMAVNVGQVAKLTGTSGRSERWEYDNSGNITKHTDAAGISQFMTYSANNQVATIREVPAGAGDPELIGKLIQTNTYYSSTGGGAVAGALAYSKDSAGNLTKYEYTANGLLSEIRPVFINTSGQEEDRGTATTFNLSGYDPFGNPNSVAFRKKVNGVWTTVSSSQTVRDNTGAIDFVLDYDSSLATETLTRKTDYAYDQLGRLTTVLSPDAYVATATRSTQYIYGPSGRPERRILPDGSWVRYEYDKAGRQIREVQMDGTFTVVEHNADGSVAATIDAKGNRTRFIYDNLSRLIQTVFPNGSSRRKVYNASGDLIQEINERGATTDYEYDSAGRLIRTRNALNEVTDYTYDEYGNQRTVTTAFSIVTNTYNAAHQLIQTVFSQRTGVNSFVEIRVDRFYYNSTGSQERMESIDLRKDPTDMSDTTIAALTDGTVTIAEFDAITAATRKRVSTTTFDHRDAPLTTTDALQQTASTSYFLSGLVKTSTDVRNAVTEYGYDKAGWEQFVALPFANAGDTQGLARVYRRDVNGRVIEVRETAYQRTSGVIDRNTANGEPVAPAGSEAPRVTKTIYDTLGRVIATQNAAGFMTRMTYDVAGNLIETIDANRRSTLSILDNMNRVVRVVQPVVRVIENSTAIFAPSSIVMPQTRTSYDAAGNVSSTTDEAGNTTTYQYDALNQRIQMTAPWIVTVASMSNGTESTVAPTWSWTYDATGKVSSETDPLNRTTLYENDLFGRVVRKTTPDPDGAGELIPGVTRMSYDAFGNLLEITEELSTGDPDNRITKHEYDALNRRTKTTLPAPGGSTTWTYDAAGNVLSETDALSRTTNYTWDLLNRQKQVQLPAANSGEARPTTQTVYNIFGDVRSTIDPLGRATTFERDALGRAVVTIMPNPDGTAWSGLRSARSEILFDAVGNVLRVTDQLGRQTTNAWNSHNQLIRTTRPDPYAYVTDVEPTESVQYDIKGNVLRTINALGFVSRTEYNALNQVILSAAQNGTGWDETKTRYDRVGNVTRVIDARGNATDTDYNDWNLATRVRLPADNDNQRPETEFRYYQSGAVKETEDPRNGITYTEYDNLGRPTLQRQPSPGIDMIRPETTWTYDVAGNVLSETVTRDATNKTKTKKDYDNLNRVKKTTISSVENPQQFVETSQTYDLVGNVLTSTDAEGRETKYQYDRLNRLVVTNAPAATTNSGDKGPILRKIYDQAGNLKADVDGLGRVTTYEYDQLDRLAKTTMPDPDGAGLLTAPYKEMRYDAAGNLRFVTDQNGNRTETVFDTRNRAIATSEVDPDPTDGILSPTTTFVYDAVGNKIQSTDPMGRVTDYEYDALNRLVKSTLPDALGSDRLGRPVTRLKYDLSGNVVSTTDAFGRTTNYQYDGLNRKVTEELPDPDTAGSGNVRPTTKYVYDALGNVLSTTDYVSSTVSRITNSEYDFLSRLTKSILPAANAGELRAVTVYAYDKVGNKVSESLTTSATNAPLRTTQFVYDRLNRLVQTILPNPTTGAAGSGPSSTTVYDLANRVVSTADALNRTTTYTYDDLDRQIRVVGADPDGIAGGTTADKIPSETRTIYDNAGNAIARLTRRKPNALGAGQSAAGVFTITTSFYDKAGRLVTSLDANGSPTQYEYDLNGNRIRLTDALFNTTRWQFDAHNRVTAETDPNRFSTVIQYDLMGNVFSSTDRRGYRTQYVRDGLNRTIREQWLTPPGQTAAIVSQFESVYDNYRRLSSIQQKDANGQTISAATFTFDDLDRVKIYDTAGTPGLQSAKITHVYDVFGNETSRTQQTGTGSSQVAVTTTYTNYDFLNRLTDLQQTASANFSGWQNKSVKMAYQADGDLQSVTRYSDLAQTSIVVQATFTPDQAGRLQAISYTRPAPSGNLPISYAYKYFADGRQLEETSSLDGLSSQDYDAAGQLTVNTKTAGSEAWTWDKNGNRLLAGTVIGKGNRVLNDGTYAFEYDAEGNLTKRTTLVSGQPTGAFVSYTWDNRGQLTKVEFYNAPVNGTATLTKTVAYVYDDAGHRIQKTLTVAGQSPVSEHFVWDGDQLVSVMNAAGAIQHQYFDGPAADQVFADQTALSGVLWPLEDKVGNVRDVISTTGTSLDHRKLNSFGVITSQTGASVDYDQFFSGLTWDSDSQLYYARARWYDPSSGEFLGEDPLGFDAGDVNLTRYSNNDPINLADTSGLSWFSKAIDSIGDAFEDIGDFFEDQWDNGNIQKGLLVAGTLASGGMLGLGLATGASGMGLAVTGMQFASGVAGSYEALSGNRIGDGTFTRVLGAATALTGGFYGPGGGAWSFGRSLSAADGIVSAYEIATGNLIGDGTLSGLFHVGNLGVNHGSTLVNPNASAATKFGVGLNLAVGGASLANTGDRGLQNSLRALSMASGIWNIGTSLVSTVQTTRATVQALRPTPRLSQQVGSIRTAGYSSEDDRATEFELTGYRKKKRPAGQPAVGSIDGQYSEYDIVEVPDTPEGRIIAALTSDTAFESDPAAAAYFRSQVDEIVINRNSEKWLRRWTDKLGYGDHFPTTVTKSGRTIHVDVYQGHGDSEIAIQAAIRSSLTNGSAITDGGLTSDYSQFLRFSVADPFTFTGPQQAANVQLWAKLTKASLQEAQEVASQIAMAQWGFVASTTPAGEILVQAVDLAQAFQKGDHRGMLIAGAGVTVGAVLGAKKMADVADAGTDAARSQTSNAKQSAKSIATTPAPKGTVPNIPAGRSKPPNSPQFQKWIDDGGSIDFLEGGTRFTDKDGLSVIYRNDLYPDFKGAGAVVDEIDIPNMRGDRLSSRGGDYYQAREALRAKGYTEAQIEDLFDPTKYRPHHFENQRTIQFVKVDVHNRFTHRGAVSDIKAKRPSVNYK